MSNKLTERELWVAYWRKHKFAPVSRKTMFSSYVPQVERTASFIEIGGFPGLNAAYFYKYVCENVYLLDYYVDNTVIERVEQQNGLPKGAIHTIEADFFSYVTTQRFDVVFSLGFIEHFHDTNDVIARHCNLLSENGKLVILLPNLRGINGLIQYLFDRENLRIHNLRCMDIPLLRQIVEAQGLRNVRVEYSRKPIVWLEPKPGIVNKIGRILTKALSYFLKLFPVKCRLLSPYIVICGDK